MASTIQITCKSELTQALLQQQLQLDSSKPREAARALQELFHKAAGGVQPLNVKVQTGGAEPVAASATFTTVSSVATDAITIGPSTLTFTSTPATEADVEVDVPSAKAFASATDISTVTGIITESAHGYVTGDVGQLSTSGALPTGFSASTDYFVLKVSDNAYRLCSSLANAQAGIFITPTAVGTGNQTFTLTANTYKAAKLAAAVNAHSVLSTFVVATYAANVVTVTCRVPGVVGNMIAISETGNTITASGSGYLAGGTGGATDAGVSYNLGIT
jgi:hypothetical protein